MLGKLSGGYTFAGASQVQCRLHGFCQLHIVKAYGLNFQNTKGKFKK